MADRYAGTARARFARGVVLIGLLSIGAPAALAGGKSAADKARHHNAEATKAFNLGLFREAAEHYEKAYKAKPLPEFLYNLGQCYRRMEAEANLRRALFYFKSYLNNAPAAPNRAEVEAEIAELERQLEALKQGAALQPPPSGSAAPRAPARPSATQRRDLAQAPRQPGKETVPPRPLWKRWWFWTAVGVALAAGAVGVGVAVGSRETWVPQGPGVEYSTFR